MLHGNKRVLLFEDVVSYSLRDEFSTARAGGAVIDKPAEPGPGIRTGQDAENTGSISSDQLVWAQHTVNGQNFGFYISQPIRAARYER